MAAQSGRTQHGFSLVELLVAMAVTTIVLGAALLAFKKMTDAGAVVVQKVEMQASARVGINSIVRDLTQAGAGGYPFGGIALPTGNLPVSACDTSGNCYLNPGTLTQDVLYGVYPFPNQGPTVEGTTMDGISIVYVDQNLASTNIPPNGAFPSGQANWDTTATANNAIDNSGTTLTLPNGLIPAVNDPVYGLKVGDVLWMNGQNGNAVGEVTNFTTGNPPTVTFAGGDPLRLNQPTTPPPFVAGAISSLANQTTPVTLPLTYPPLIVQRIFIVTYFIQPVDANNNPLAVANWGAATDYRLMRQVNAQPAIVVAEHIVNLKFSYDLFDTVANAQTSNVAAPATAFNQIRNVYVAVTARTARTPGALAANNNLNYSYATLYTEVSPRNLSFKNIYQ